MLRNHEIRGLAFELAGKNPSGDYNAEYHRHIPNWSKSRGGAEIGAFDAWKRGWQEGAKKVKASAVRQD